MRRLIITFALISAISGIAGCAPRSGESVTATAVRNAIIAACGWVEPISNVAAIISNSGVVMTVGAIASAVCAAVIPSREAMRRGFAKPVVFGVQLRGQFQ